MRIAMWSGPRNISTAMMRAWENRADCAVVDEPFYGAYLSETGITHPMGDAIMGSMACDWQVVADQCAMAGTAPIEFQKHMCQHMVPEAPIDWMEACRHAFLIRPPEEVAASFSVKYPGLVAEDLGFRRQAELFNQVCLLSDTPPPVIEARDVLENPAGMLAALCERLGVPFDPAMLTWPAGFRDSDGIWAAHWYGAVERSTRFAPPRPPQEPAAELAAIIAECRPHYEAMRAWRLTV
ncbi:HAD family hydrolase [Rhodobacteraceae bacterium NNCM2]|nr:HAD family hydrolase [Coraliihabitans acroporae]